MPDKSGRKSIVFFYNDYESLGLEYISAVLKSKGFDVSLHYRNLVDFYAFDSGRDVNAGYYKKIAREICDLRPDVLGMSLLTDSFRSNMAIAEEVKRLDPGINILAGGVHASLLPELTLGYPQIDALCAGEGEMPVLAYMHGLDAILSGKEEVIDGIVYKQDGRLVGDPKRYAINNDLDDLPYPDKSIFYDADPSMKSHYFVQCSRGCPFKCSFCINDYLSRAVGGKRFRRRTPENIIEELKDAARRYAPSFVVFVDECFGADMKWTERFLVLYKENVGLPFLVSVHPDMMSGRLADLMRDANCWYVAMGVQSLNVEIAEKVLRRRTNRAKIASAIDNVRSRDMVLQCDHIFGIQGETERDMIDALEFYNEHRPSIVSVYWLSYYPKAYITEHAKNLGILSDSDIEDIEHGRLSSGIKRVQGHHAVNFWFNYFGFFPRWFVRFMIRTGVFKLFRIKNFYMASALPRAMHAMLHKKDWNRYYMKRVIMKKMNNFRFWGAD